MDTTALDLWLGACVRWALIAFGVYALLRALTAKLKLDVRGRAVLITGCDSGLGWESALRLHAQGLRVFAACYTAQGQQQLAQAAVEQARAQGVSADAAAATFTTVQLDVGDGASVTRCFEAVRDAVGRAGLWALINNAGLGDTFLIELTPLDVYRRVMDVNYFGTIRMCQTFLPLLKLAAAPGGCGAGARPRIVNVTSFLSRTSAFAMSGYAASKFALRAFSDTLRHELSAWDIAVCQHEPGTMDTPMLARTTQIMHAQWNAAPLALRHAYGEGFLGPVSRAKQLMSVLARPPRAFTGAHAHAVTARWPRAHYVDGWDSFAMGRVLPLLPTWLYDAAALTLVWPPTPDAVVRARQRAKGAGAPGLGAAFGEAAADGTDVDGGAPKND